MVDDMADACIHLMKTYSDEELVNIGTGEDISIANSPRVAATIWLHRRHHLRSVAADGTPRKLLDVSASPTRLARAHLAAGWNKLAFRRS